MSDVRLDVIRSDTCKGQRAKVHVLPNENNGKAATTAYKSNDQRVEMLAAATAHKNYFNSNVTYTPSASQAFDNSLAYITRDILTEPSLIGYLHYLTSLYKYILNDHFNTVANIINPLDSHTGTGNATELSAHDNELVAHDGGEPTWRRIGSIDPPLRIGRWIFKVYKSNLPDPPKYRHCGPFIGPIHEPHMQPRVCRYAKKPLPDANKSDLLLDNPEDNAHFFDRSHSDIEFNALFFNSPPNVTENDMSIDFSELLSDSIPDNTESKVLFPDSLCDATEGNLYYDQLLIDSTLGASNDITIDTLGASNDIAIDALGASDDIAIDAPLDSETPYTSSNDIAIDALGASMTLASASATYGHHVVDQDLKHVNVNFASLATLVYAPSLAYTLMTAHGSLILPGLLLLTLTFISYRGFKVKYVHWQLLPHQPSQVVQYLRSRRIIIKHWQCRSTHHQLRRARQWTSPCGTPRTTCSSGAATSSPSCLTCACSSPPASHTSVPR